MHTTAKRPQELFFLNTQLQSYDGGNTFFGFSFPCQENYQAGLVMHKHSCTHKDPHGHLMLFAYDEAHVLPSPITSQSMLGSVLAKLVEGKHLARDEMRMILSQQSITRLQKDLSQEERSILNDSRKFSSFCDVRDFFRT